MEICFFDSLKDIPTSVSIRRTPAQLRFSSGQVLAKLGSVITPRHPCLFVKGNKLSWV